MNNKGSLHSEPFCFHTQHFFTNICCDKQSLIKRIAILFFHIITLGIPYVIYHLIQHYQTSEPLKPQAIASLKSPDTSTACSEAFEYAKTELAKHSDLKPFPFKLTFPYINEIDPPVMQLDRPINPAISFLTSLLAKRFKQFEKQIQRETDPWSNPEFLQTADACMKLSYVIGVLSLEDLPAFRDQLPDPKPSLAKVVTSQGSYYALTYYYCSQFYRLLRGQCTLSPDEYHPFGALKYESQPNQPDPAYYTKGTLQNGWNTLYNQYCAQIRKTIPEAELLKADGRCLHFTKPDTLEKTCQAEPYTIRSYTFYL